MKNSWCGWVQPVCDRVLSFSYRWTVGLISLVWVLVASSGEAATSKSADQDPVFIEARRLFWSGQYDRAEAQFKQFQLIHPDHEPTKNFLLMIGQSRKFDRHQIDLTRQRLEETRIEKLKFDAADWRSAFKRVQEILNSEKDGPKSAEVVNFIYMLPSKFNAKVSLDLQDVTAERALELICQQTGMRLVIDTWAVIIDMPETGK